MDSGQFGLLCHQQGEQGAKQAFTSAADVMHKRKEAPIQRQFLLRDAAMGSPVYPPTPVGANRPQPSGIHMEPGVFTQPLNEWQWSNPLGCQGEGLLGFLGRSGVCYVALQH